MTIAHVADIHAGRFTNGPVLSEIAEATNALHADMVLFAGDLINDSLSYLDDGIAVMKKISGPLALCEGNHDLIEDPDEFRSRVKASGLLGMQWGTDSKHLTRIGQAELADSAERLRKLQDPAAFQILLAHHPHS
jgi:DNA repair exonuclease SbcCD nuclease subunit